MGKTTAIAKSSPLAITLLKKSKCTTFQLTFDPFIIRLENAHPIRTHPRKNMS